MRTTLLATAVFFLVLTTSVFGGSTEWQDDVGGWSVDSNWTHGEPTIIDDADVNNAGTSEITETGEVCHNLRLAAGSSESSGTVHMTAGTLTCDWLQAIGYDGTGTFIQDGGTNSIPNYDLALGSYNGSHGTYQLCDGELSADEEWIGLHGTGVFEQTGGTNTISTNLNLGVVETEGFGTGTYTISGGELWAEIGTLYVGGNGTGTFAVTGYWSDPHPDDGKPSIKFGAYSQNGNGTLLSTLAADEITMINVTGSAALSGTWDVADDHAALGKFSILTAEGGISGSFTQINLPYSQWSWGIDDGNTLWVQTPEPATLCLLTVGGLAVIHRRRG